MLASFEAHAQTKGRSLPLAPELQAKIFGMLNVRDLACAEAVCKDWAHVINTHSLWDQQAAQHRSPCVGPKSEQSPCPFSTSQAKSSVASHVVASRLERRLPRLTRLAGHTAAITSCSAGPGIIASASEDKTVRLWEQKFGRSGWACTAVLKQRHTPQAVEVVEPNLILTTSQAGVLLWRDFTLARRFQVPGQTSDLRHLGCKDGMVVGAAANSGRLQVWDLYSGSLKQLLRPSESAITSLQLVDSLSGSPACLAATGHADGLCNFMDLSSGSLAVQLPGSWQQGNCAKGDRAGIHMSAFMTVANSRSLCAVARHRCLQGWDLRSLKRPLWLNPLGTQAPDVMTIPSPGEQHLAVPLQWRCSRPTAPAIFNLLEGTCMNYFGGFTNVTNRAGSICPEAACTASHGSHIVTAQKISAVWSLSVWSYR
ncbi:hypothetical protein WJX74_009706 [Apatococcus lobatus]|uniref:F-box domain-containing protein n=1 Tax=Apatococcus lobatus TaxID=904363 RepID=A0AAW1RT48_9CHLO